MNYSWHSDPCRPLPVKSSAQESAPSRNTDAAKAPLPEPCNKSHNRLRPSQILPIATNLLSNWLPGKCIVVEQPPFFFSLCRPSLLPTTPCSRFRVSQPQAAPPPVQSIPREWPFGLAQGPSWRRRAAGLADQACLDFKQPQV